MKDEKELHDELEELAPFLRKMKEREEGFRLPAHYFKTLPDEVLKQVRLEKSARTTWMDNLSNLLQSFLQPKYVLAFAGVAVVIFVAMFFLFRQAADTIKVSPVAGMTLEDISDEALQAYIDRNIESIDKELILETHYAGEDGQPLPETTPAAADDDIEQYLDSIIDEIDMDELEDIL
jgi:hypothetical protein